MPFLVCQKCGGYYQLQEEESPDDFESCTCGGTLDYVQNIPQPDEKIKNMQDNNYDHKINSNKFVDDDNGLDDEGIKSICPNCLTEDEDGIFCSSCGGKLLFVKNGKVINRSKNDNQPQNKKIININTANLEINKNIRKTSNSKQTKQIKGIPSLIDAIGWLGVSAGVILLLIGIVIGFYALANLISMNSYYRNFEFADFALFFNSFVILTMILGIFSGILSSYLNQSKDYVEGLLNGFIVGAFSALILGVYEAIATTGIVGFVVLMIGIPILSVISSVGGVMGVFIQTKLTNDKSGDDVT